MKNKALIHHRLLSWYDNHRRKLPWREHPSPYRTWISEIMLQQTQVSTVIPYFERFLKRFPKIDSLANADEREVLRLWAGLGYYSRAKNLHKAAKLVLEQYQGKFPDTLEAVLELPGIGRYTAGAILSIAFGKPHPLLDGNVMRVFSRIFGIRGNIKSLNIQSRMWKIAEELVHLSRPGDWNQALMELGALICAPSSPHCDRCPLMKQCAAYRHDLQDRLPEMPAKKKAVNLSWSCLWIEQGGKIVLHNRQESERFLPGHWALPEPRHFHNGIQAEMERKPAGTARHTITHHRIKLDVHKAKLSGNKLPSDMRWIPKSQVGRMLVSSLWKKAAKAVTQTKARV